MADAPDFTRTIDDKKKKARAEDTERAKTAQLGGKKLEGDELKKFNTMRAGSKLMQGMYNEDGTPKE